jgi:hypothetical protein
MVRTVNNDRACVCWANRAPTASVNFPLQALHLQLALKFTRFVASLLAIAMAANTVHSIKTRRTSRHTWRTLMDLLNTFFVFNLTATAAVLLGFFLMRDSAAITAATVKAKLNHFNAAGAAGAATSMVLLSSVAVLFR